MDTESFTLYDLRVTVVSIEGQSVCGLAVGDCFEVTGSNQLRIPAGKHFCLYALGAVLPLLSGYQRAAQAGDWMTQESLVACPDPEEAAHHAHRTARPAHPPHRRPDVGDVEPRRHEGREGVRRKRRLLCVLCVLCALCIKP